MTLSIQLLGSPLIVKDGAPAAPPRGRKPWAVLAYLLCSHRAISRERLASLLFLDAADPSGALRWNLTELRRLLGDAASVGGQPVEITLPPDAYVDVWVLTGGKLGDALSVARLGGEMLEGFAFPGCAAFECWLLSERRHLQAASEAVLKEAALAQLVAGEEARAIDLAARLVAMNPLDESYQELLIRALAASGDRPAAARQLSACINLFRSELGIEPGPEVFAAVHAGDSSLTTAPVTGRAAARAQLEAGEAAIEAGALEAGLQCLRRATAEAHSCGDLELKAKALFSLGSALVYSAHGKDEEGAGAMHQVVSLSLSTRQLALAASAHQILAVIEILHGQHDRGAALLDSASQLAGEHGPVQANGMLIRGGSLVETGNYEEALRQLRGAVQLAEECGDIRTVASSLAEIGRALFLKNDLSASAEALERSLDIARSRAMTSFLPFPEALLGQVELASGKIDSAKERLEHALALGCLVGDPCHEGLARTGLGLIAARRRDVSTALESFNKAINRCATSTDASVWVLAYALDAMCTLAISEGMPEAPAWIGKLEILAGRTGMREMLVRAHLHKHDIGYSTALDAAVVLAYEVDNCHLQEAVERRRRRAPATLNR